MWTGRWRWRRLCRPGEDCLFGGGMEKGIPADGGDISEKTVQGGLSAARRVYVKSPDLLAAAQAVFRWENQLMYINSGVDGEGGILCDVGGRVLPFERISYILRENQMMQDYMILRKDARRVETGTGDRVIRDFRNRMEERQQEAASRYGTIRALGTLCGVLSVAVLAGGVVLFGNYQKMREMESVLVSVLPDGVRGTADGKEAVTVEQLRGSVTPLESSDVDADGTTAENGGQAHKWTRERGGWRYRGHCHSRQTEWTGFRRAERRGRKNGGDESPVHFAGAGGTARPAESGRQFDGGTGLSGHKLEARRHVHGRGWGDALWDLF